MDGVGNEVLHHLLQADIIAPDGQEAVRLRPEGDPFLGGFALAGGADGGGGFVQGHPVLIEQHLLLLELGRQKKVFR